MLKANADALQTEIPRKTALNKKDVKKRLLSFVHLPFPVFFSSCMFNRFFGVSPFYASSIDSISFCAVSSWDVFHLMYPLFSNACVIFVSIVFDLCRWKVHSTRPPSADDGGQAFSSSSRFCIYVRFRLQLPSAGVQALFCINLLHLTSKSHTRGVCKRLLVDPRQCKRHRGVESNPGNGSAQTQWLAQDLWLA